MGRDGSHTSAFGDILDGLESVLIAPGVGGALHVRDFVGVNVYGLATLRSRSRRHGRWQGMILMRERFLYAIDTQAETL